MFYPKKISLMNMKRILVTFIIMTISGGFFHNSFAQNFGPERGDKQVSLRLGKAVDYGTLTSYEVNQGIESETTSMSQPVSIYSMNGNSSNNDIVNAIGIELKYFLSSKLALRLDGSGMITSTPSQDYVTGVNIDATYPGTSIPNFAYQDGKTTKQFYADLGVDYYFETKVSRLFPFVGIQGNSVYAQMEIFDGYRGVDDSGEVISSYDVRRGEAYGFGGSIVAGVDYYLAEGFFLGVEIKAASYMYNAKRIFHQQGMAAQSGVSHVTSFLAQPILKLGFKF